MFKATTAVRLDIAYERIAASSSVHPFRRYSIPAHFGGRSTCHVIKHVEHLTRLDSVSARGARLTDFELDPPSIYGIASPRKAICVKWPSCKASCTREPYEADSARLRLAVEPCISRMVNLSVRTRRALLNNALPDFYQQRSFEQKTSLFHPLPSTCALASPRSHI